jgi:hypothetical protein
VRVESRFAKSDYESMSRRWNHHQAKAKNTTTYGSCSRSPLTMSEVVDGFANMPSQGASSGL